MALDSKRNLEHSLAQTLTKAHGGKNIGETVAEICDHEDSSHLLLGLDADASRVYYWFTTQNTIISYPAYPFSKHMGNAISHDVAVSITDLHEVITERQWGWIHPRFEWLVE